MPNQYAQSHFLNEDLSESLNAACESLNDQIHGDIDLIFAFVSGQTAEEFDRCMPRIKEKTGARVVLGCSCETAIGGAYELEHAAAISLWAAKLPDAEITPMHLTYQRSGGDAAIVGWPSTTDGIWADNSSLLLLGEPFGFPIDVLLERFNEDRPGVRIAGGISHSGLIGRCLILPLLPHPRGNVNSLKQIAKDCSERDKWFAPRKGPAGLHPGHDSRLVQNC